MVSSTKAGESTMALLDADVNYVFDLGNYMD
jgi:hypothetical protein